MLKLEINPVDEYGPNQNGLLIRDRVENAYERIAGSDDYHRNDNNLRLIQICVVTVSAFATGYVNAFAHQKRLGWIGAGILALLIMGFVEKFYFTLRHGLTTTYKSGRQRFVATLCYRTIQATMILNAAVLCAWVAGVAMPGFLTLWNHWSITVHFALALLGVSAVRDADAVVENRMRELKAEAAPLDILTIRKAAAAGNPLVFLAARLRGMLDGVALASKLLRDEPGPPPGDLDGAGGNTDASNQVSKEMEAGEHPGRVIQLSAAHRQPCPTVAALVTSAELILGDNLPGEQMAGEPIAGEPIAGEQDSQWMKSILPDPLDGWWDVRSSGEGFSIKFRWRGPNQQSLTFPRLTGEQFNTLRESSHDHASNILREQITEHLRAFSLDPAKLTKAQFVARKLGINLADNQAAGAAAK
ncbi:MAG: hypothetical protein ACREBD_27575 [Blastocatellia bacterium]